RDSLRAMHSPQVWRRRQALVEFSGFLSSAAFLRLLSTIQRPIPVPSLSSGFSEGEVGNKFLDISSTCIALLRIARHVCACDSSNLGPSNVVASAAGFVSSVRSYGQVPRGGC